MRSKASVRGIPIHPALVHYPWAFLSGGFLFDLAGSLTATPSLWTAGAWIVLAGIATALVAAVPGFLDYVFTVPPNSTGKRRATRHLIVNLSAVGLFAAGWVLRGSISTQPGYLVLLLEGVGAVLLGIGGYMGGVLVSRNQVGVDHRYAKAGKWQDQAVGRKEGEDVVTVRAPGLEKNQMMLLRVDGSRFVLGRTEEGYVAFDDRCTHRGGTLAGGALICGTVQCPWHGSQFDVATGQVRAGPATEPIQAYAVEVSGAYLRIHLPR